MLPGADRRRETWEASEGGGEGKGWRIRTADNDKKECYPVTRKKPKLPVKLVIEPRRIRGIKGKMSS